MATNGTSAEDTELWRHSDPHSSQMYAFLQHVSKKHQLDIKDYDGLYQWSIDHPAAFWEEIWHWTGIKAHKQYDSVSIVLK